MPQGIMIMLDKTLPPKAEAVSTAGDAGLGIEARGEPQFSGYLGPCVLASLMDSTIDFGTTLSPVGHLTNHSSSKKHWSAKPPTSHFLDKIDVFQIYLKGSFWILLKVKVDIPDQSVLLSVFSLPQSSTQYLYFPRIDVPSCSLILEARAAHHAPYLNF